MEPEATHLTNHNAGAEERPVPLTAGDRIAGGIIGSLVGDALGVPVEFSTRDQRDADPVVAMRSYGMHHQPAGSWSDDGALLLCTMESLIAAPSEDVAGRLYVRWLHDGFLAARGLVFDAGGTTTAALTRIANGTPAARAGGDREDENGNGSLMRILPVAMRFAEAASDVVVSCAMRWSAITHRHARSQLACAYYCLVAQQLMRGAGPEDACRDARIAFAPVLARFPGEQPHFARILDPRLGQTGRRDIRSSGYVIDTLEAALWCLLQGGAFRDIVLRAVNLGGDTDTTGCVAGGLAGVFHGRDAIPKEWINALATEPDWGALVDRFLTAVGESGLTEPPGHR